MQLSSFPIVSGKFIKRVNRFIARVMVEESGRHHEENVHVANTGRMQELLVPGACVQMAYNPSPKRKTAYTLLLIQYENTWVCIHSTMANQLAFEYLSRQEGVTELRREVRYQNSRFDLSYQQNGQEYLTEVKSVNLVEEGTALFPDAPTERGAKHLKELIEAGKQGYRARVLFIIQREDAVCFKPHTARDPVFSKLLKEAAKAGVLVTAYKCRVNEAEIFVDCPIPVLLDE